MLITRDIGVNSHKPHLALCAGDIRLVGGSVPSEGRVELFYEGGWRGVLVFIYLTAAAARVACRQVGYPYSDGTRYFEPGSGPARVTIISCNGDEERIEQCEHFGWRSFIDFNTTAGVSCRGECLQGVR